LILCKMSELGSFFHGPHSKQGDVSKILKFLNIRGRGASM
jgi:hypothetical protein